MRTLIALAVLCAPALAAPVPKELRKMPPVPPVELPKAHTGFPIVKDGGKFVDFGERGYPLPPEPLPKLYDHFPPHDD